MKESITKFDLEAAFKALDAIDTPKASKGLKANKVVLTEKISSLPKTDLLVEEYYDVGNTTELESAKEAREAEVAKAKLARIEKIVDLDADSPEDLLTSYVGKLIIQCPQCMTLFYKSREDIIESEEDPNTVNVNEVCQHCGNDSGYTLIGKVGEASQEEEEETELSSDLDTETTEEETDEGTEEDISDEENSEDTEDLTDLEDLNFEIEDDESEETNEDFNNITKTSKNLFESADNLDVSPEDFEKLISSPEFKKPISDTTARAMMQEFNEDSDASGEDLTEGGLGLLGKTLAKKAKQIGQKIKGKASTAIDKFADNTMTREEKADWVMKNTLKPGVKEVVIDNDGNAIPDEKDRKFDTYVVIGYKGYYSDGKTIGMSPTRTNKDLVIGMSEPQFRDTYTEAEELSKGWSMEQKGGPAFILLAKNKNIGEAVYLCQYFKGELDTKQDQLENYFQAAKKDLEGKAHIAKGGGVKGDQGANEPKTEERAASALKVGDIIVLGKIGAEVIEINESKFQAGSLTIKVKMADGDTDIATFKGDQKVTVVIKTSNESLETNTNELTSIMENLEELNENALEELISQSLVETYKNVAGFRLTNCEYLNEEFVINGKVLFESGALRDLSYKFIKALAKDKKITFTGLNEKLGANKRFSLTGITENNVFIAESFKQHKKI